jgi:hypothetical protein
VHFVYASDRLLVIGIRHESVGHVNTANHQDALLFFNLSDNLTEKAGSIGPDPARLQRASEGTE